MPINPFRTDPAHPFQLVKFLSWSSLLLILGMGFLISTFLGNYARQTVLKKQQEFALLLAENLNHQIYQRFTLPTILGFGRIQLKNKAQFQRLDKVVATTTYSFNIMEVRIYDGEGTISYSTNEYLVNNKDLAGDAFKRAYSDGEVSFNLLNRVGAWRSLFTFKQKPKSFVLRTIYPLRAERTLEREKLGPIMGVLEFTQDITADYQTIIIFQWLITFVVFASSMLLFLLLYKIIRRADKALAEQNRDRERLEKELHQNEKLASMGRMVASIAHELRNPLGIIRSSSQILHSKAEKNDDASARLLKATLDESIRLSRTIDDFLDYARPRNPRKEEVSIPEVLRKVLTFMEADSKYSKVTIALNFDDDLMVQGDRDLIYRAFYNLMANALQAVDKDGTITLDVQEEDDQIKISIQDTGPGFDDMLTDKYLEPFYTTKDQGTGLGLAIVNNIISNHNGTLTLSNSEDGGGLVTVTLPKTQNGSARHVEENH